MHTETYWFWDGGGGGKSVKIPKQRDYIKNIKNVLKKSVYLEGGLKRICFLHVRLIIILDHKNLIFGFIGLSLGTENIGRQILREPVLEQLNTKLKILKFDHVEDGWNNFGKIA